MRIRDILADLFGALALFGLLYAGFFNGLGAGWVQ